MQELTIPNARPVALSDAKTPAAEALCRSLPVLVELLPTELEARQFAVAAMGEANKLGKEAGPRSVIVALANCATLNLLPGSGRGEAFLVPFKGVVQLIIGYPGIRRLAYRSGWLASMETDLVFQGEEFSLSRDSQAGGSRLYCARA